MRIIICECITVVIYGSNFFRQVIYVLYGNPILFLMPSIGFVISVTTEASFVVGLYNNNNVNYLSIKFGSRYRCSKCDISFSRMDSYQKHFELVHSEKPIQLTRILILGGGFAGSFKDSNLYPYIPYAGMRELLKNS